MAMISMETVDYIARVLEIRGTFFRMVARASREHPHRVIRQTVLAIYVHVLPVALAIARPSYNHFQPHSLGESSITAVLSRRLTTVRQNIRASILRTSCGFGMLATFIDRMSIPCTPCSRRIASRSNTSSTDGSFVSCAFSDIFSSRFSAPILSFPPVATAKGNTNRRREGACCGRHEGSCCPLLQRTVLSVAVNDHTDRRCGKHSRTRWMKSV